MITRTTLPALHMVTRQLVTILDAPPPPGLSLREAATLGSRVSCAIAILKGEGTPRTVLFQIGPHEDDDPAPTDAQQATA